MAATAASCSRSQGRRFDPCPADEAVSAEDVDMHCALGVSGSDSGVSPYDVVIA